MDNIWEFTFFLKNPMGPRHSRDFYFCPINDFIESLIYVPAFSREVFMKK